MSLNRVMAVVLRHFTKSGSDVWKSKLSMLTSLKTLDTRATFASFGTNRKPVCDLPLVNKKVSC